MGLPVRREHDDDASLTPLSLLPTFHPWQPLYLALTIYHNPKRAPMPRGHSSHLLNSVTPVRWREMERQQRSSILNASDAILVLSKLLLRIWRAAPELWEMPWSPLMGRRIQVTAATVEMTGDHPPSAARCLHQLHHHQPQCAFIVLWCAPYTSKISETM